MLRPLGHHLAGGVEPGSSGPSRHLVELSGRELPHPGAVELGESGQQHRADGHVDADPEGVGSADHPQQAALGELLDEPPVLGQHPRVVHADPGPHEAGEGGAEARREPEPADRLGDRIPLLPGCDPRTRERLRAFDGGGLREMDDVDRGEALLEQLLDGLVNGRHDVAVVQGHGTFDPGDPGDLAAGAAFEIGGEVRDVAEGRRHQQELHARQQKQRHLPRPAALGVGVVVELVHHDQLDRCVGAAPQRDVREDLRRAADDRRIRIHARVAGHHADVRGPEDVDQGEELLTHERLDRSRVEAALPLPERDRVGRDGDERLARAGRRRQHEVTTEDEFEHRLLLRRIEPDALLTHPVLEDADEGIRVPGGRKELGEGGLRHGSESAPRGAVPRLGTCRTTYAGAEMPHRMWQSSGGRAGLIDVRERALADDDVRVPAGWYPDPLGLPQLRWWDNHAWTEHTSDARQPMMAQETVVSARLAFKDDDEDDRDEQAFDDLPTRRQRREQEQPREDESGGAASVDADLPNADALLSLEAPSKQERDLEQPSPAARIASTGLPENAPTSAPYRLDTQYDDLTGGNTKPWAFDDPDGADEPYGYSGDPSGHGYYAPHDQYGYRGDPYSRRGDTPKYGQPAQPMSAQQASYAESQNHPASYSFWADPYSQRPNPYAQPAEQQPQQPGLPVRPAAGDSRLRTAAAAAPGFGQPAAAPGFGQPSAATNFVQPTFAPGVGQPPAGAAVPMYTPMFSPDAAPDLQPVAYPTRRGSHAPASLPVSTGPIWAMALLPVIMLVLGLLFLLSGGAGKLSPIFAGVIVGGPYLLAIILAVADRTALQKLGYEHTASWAWAILGAPAYLIVRLASVVRETGRGFGPLLTWIATALLMVVSVIAVPGIIMALAPATFAAEAEASIRSDAAANRAVLDIECPPIPPLLIQGTMQCKAISDSQIFPITVSLQRSNGWIDWRVDDWGLYATNR